MISWVPKHLQDVLFIEVQVKAHMCKKNFFGQRTPLPSLSLWLSIGRWILKLPGLPSPRVCILYNKIYWNEAIMKSGLPDKVNKLADYCQRTSTAVYTCSILGN